MISSSQLDSIPYFWNSTDTRELLVWSRQGETVLARPRLGIRYFQEILNVSLGYVFLK